MYREVGGCGGLVGEKLGALLAGSGVEIKFVVGHLPYDVSRRIHHMGLAHMDTPSTAVAHKIMHEFVLKTYEMYCLPVNAVAAPRYMQPSTFIMYRLSLSSWVSPLPPSLICVQ